MHLRVDLSDGRRTFVPKGGDGGADKELQCVDVAQGLDPSPEGPRPTLPAKESPGSLTRLLNLCNYVCYACAFTYQELNWNPRCMIPRYLCSFTSMLGR
jgi:hypothetical protein